MADLTGDECAVLRPGDRLVIRVNPERATPALMQEFRQQLRENMPDVDVVLICADQLVVRSDRVLANGQIDG